MPLDQIGMGKRWTLGMSAGTDPFLCQDDQNRFREMVDQQEPDLNCLTTSQVKEIETFLMENQCRQVSERLNFMGCHERALSLLQAEIARTNPSSKL
jgi:hypothetical protein